MRVPVVRLAEALAGDDGDAGRGQQRGSWFSIRARRWWLTREGRPERVDASRKVAKGRIRDVVCERGAVGIPVRQRRPRGVHVDLAALDGPLGPALEVLRDECVNLVVRHRAPVAVLRAGARSPRATHVVGIKRGLDGGVDEVLGVRPYPRALHRREQLARAVQVRQPDQRRLVHRIGGARAGRGAKWRGDSARPRKTTTSETTKSHDCFLNVVSGHWPLGRVTSPCPPAPTPRRPRPRLTPRTRRTPRSKPRRTIQSPPLTWTRASPRPSFRACPIFGTALPSAACHPCGRTPSPPRARGVPATSCSTASSVSDSRTSASGASSTTASRSSTSRCATPQLRSLKETSSSTKVSPRSSPHSKASNSRTAPTWTALGSSIS